MKQVIYVLIGLLAGFVLAGALFIVTRLPSGEAVKLQPSPTQPSITIQIIGAVVRPGVYSFTQGSRVQDAVTGAGGLLSTADTNSINLAAKLEDGQQVNIPFQGGALPGPGSSFNPPFPGSGNSSNAPFLVLTSPTVPAGNLININTATLTQLDALPGIGPTTAQKIIDYRTQHGPFQKIEDIMNVAGIGPATFDDLKTLISVQ
jgi:competence protein ComEA